MITCLQKVLMERDHLSAAEADGRIAEAHEWVLEGADPKVVLAEEFFLGAEFAFAIL